MENKIMNEKAKIAITLKKSREQIALHRHRISEKSLGIIEIALDEKYEKATEDDEDDYEYSVDMAANIEKLFKSLLNKYEIDYAPEKSIIDNSTFIKTPEWLALKRSVLNPNNNDNKCFQYSVTLSLYHEQIGKNYCRISKIKPFVDNINWENINFPRHEQDYQTFEMNNKSIYSQYIQCDEKINHLHKSKFNKTRENRVILLILKDDKKQHYVAVKNLNSLLKDKNKCSEYFCINCFRKFRTKQRLEKHYQSENC